ncbi:MAG: hypothetical protein ACK4IC_08600 [Erythrobacter sp.]
MTTGTAKYVGGDGGRGGIARGDKRLTVFVLMFQEQTAGRSRCRTGKMTACQPLIWNRPLSPQCSDGLNRP